MVDKKTIGLLKKLVSIQSDTLDGNAEIVVFLKNWIKNNLGPRVSIKEVSTESNQTSLIVSRGTPDSFFVAHTDVVSAIQEQFSLSKKKIDCMVEVQ